MCNYIRPNRQFHLLGLTLPKNGFRFGNSKNWWQNKNQHPRYAMCANFQTKWTTLKSLAQVCPEMDLGLEIEKRVNQNPRDTLCANFQSIWRTLALFWYKFAQKWILRSEFQKYKSRFGISTSKIPWAPIFSLNGQLWIFWPKFWEIAQLRTIFWF